MESSAAQAGGGEPKSAKRLPAETKVPAKATSTASGAYWVQVGAFLDPDKAKRLAATLRQQNFNVSESTAVAGERQGSPASPAPASAPPSVDRYNVYVSGAPSANLGAKLTAKGLSVEPAVEGVVVRPSLPLRDAVALSKELAVDGLKVQVKRAGRAEGAPTPPTTAPSGERATLHRVRVGAFPDRAAATAAARQLEEKGFKPFIARGPE